MGRIDTLPTRLVLIGVLLGGVGLACVGYDTLEPDPTEHRYPGTVDVVEDEAAVLGERVTVGGRVVGTDPVRVVDTYTLVRDGATVGGSVEYTVTGVQTPVARGEGLEVFGTLTDARTVRAANVVVVPSGNFLYMYAVSALAGVWVLGRLLRGWRLDPRRLSIRPREEE